MPDRSPEEMLAKVDLFAGLSSRQIKKLVGRSRTIQHPAGKEVATEGLGALAFHLVLDGEAEVSSGGTVLRTLGPGDYFGEISMIDGRPRSATVRAVDALSLLAVPHQDFTDLVRSEPDFAQTLLVLLCARLREAEARHTVS